MSDKYNKFKPKIPKQVKIGLIATFLFLIGLFLLTVRTNEEKIYDSYSTTASTLTENHPFYEISYNGTIFEPGLKKILEEDELVILYIGSHFCSVCIQTIGNIEKYYFQEDMDEIFSQIFYYQDWVGEDASNDRNDMLEAFPDIQRSTPQVIVFRNGELFFQYQSPTIQNPSPQDYARAASNFFKDLKYEISKL